MRVCVGNADLGVGNKQRIKCRVGWGGRGGKEGGVVVVQAGGEGRRSRPKGQVRIPTVRGG